MKLVVKLNDSEEGREFVSETAEELFQKHYIVYKEVRGGILFDLPKKRKKNNRT